MILPDSLWWEEIVGPSRFLSDIEGALDGGKSVVMETTTAFPYRESFVAGLDHWLGNNGITCVQVDCSGMDLKGDPYRYLIEQTDQPRQLLNDYLRQKSPQFLRSSGMFSGKVVWLHHIPAPQVKLWLRLVSMHASTSFEHGVFLIETETLGTESRSSGQIPTYRYGDYVRTDDLRLFASTLVQNAPEQNSDMNQYVVELTSALCVVDSELAEQLLGNPHGLMEAPLERLQSVFAYWDEGRGRNMPAHPYTLLRRGDESELNRRVWAAQVRVGYPLIEMERLRLIQKWYAQIKTALSTAYRESQSDEKHYVVDSDKKHVSDPYDLEVGMLVRMTALRRHSDAGSFLLYFPTEDYELLHRLRDCRNKLAHLNTCSFEQFRVLLGG